MAYFYINPETDPAHNLATEEYLLHHFDEPVFHLWQNKPVVIIGRNQLAEAEVDFEFLRENNIPLIRRFSGGGAVYQDLGNVNLSFMNSDRNTDFDKYNLQILDFLKSLNLSPTSNERRAIFINDKKISGSSQFVRGRKAVYHITLLFSSNLEWLEESLQGTAGPKLQKKHVPSVRSNVTNLSPYFPQDFNIVDFRDKIVDFFVNQEDKPVVFSNEDFKNIDQLKSIKYMNEDWNLRGNSK